jgi:rare lipoprotein A
MKANNLFATLLFVAISTFSLQAQEIGLAGYYADEFEGSTTAYGERYDKNKLTAAHKTHPLGTYLRITRLDNKKSVVVRVNDQGPYVSRRIVDLSRAAAKKIDMLRDGEAEVQIEVVGTDATRETTSISEPAPTPVTITRGPVPPNTERVVPTPSPVKKIVVPKTEPKPELKRPDLQEKGTLVTFNKEKVKPQPDKASLVRDEYNAYGLYKVALEHSKSAGFGIQLVAVSTYESAMAKVVELQSKWFDDVLLSIAKGADGRPDYKVILGPFKTEAAAQNYLVSLKKKYKMAGFVLNLGNIAH